MESIDITTERIDYPLQSSEVITEIFVLLQEDPRIGYSASTIRKILNKKYATTFTTRQIKNRLEMLQRRGRCVKVERKNPNHVNNLSTYQAHQGPTILLDSPAYRVASYLLEIQDARTTGSNRDNQESSATS